MRIVLICRDEKGQVAFSAGRIEGIPVTERRYAIAEHRVILDGYPAEVLHHDADELLAMPNGLYRMPTPAEADAMAEGERAASSVQEAAPVSPKKAKAEQNGG